MLFFQYISHRVLRWTVTPFLLIAIFILNIPLLTAGQQFYGYLMAAQIVFYLAAITGFILKNKKFTFKPVFVPYYFCVMNYAALAGLKKYVSGNQKVTWDKAKRKETSLN
ncbi:MAG: hypothetical protein H7334_13660 [Ferruginibacter sp.]|nr:hypothetical protein [Ferruginibacter sp.]